MPVSSLDRCDTAEERVVGCIAPAAAGTAGDFLGAFHRRIFLAHSLGTLPQSASGSMATTVLAMTCLDDHLGRRVLRGAAHERDSCMQLFHVMYVLPGGRSRMFCQHEVVADNPAQLEARATRRSHRQGACALTRPQ